MRWRIPARFVSEGAVIVEAETEREALRQFRARAWLEQDDFDVVRASKTGPVEPLAAPAKPPVMARSFAVGTRVRYKDGRRGVVEGEHPLHDGLLVRFDGDSGQSLVSESDLARLKPGVGRWPKNV